MLYIILTCISCFMFFADLLLVYFIFILNYGNDISQNANLSCFSFFIQVQNGSLRSRETTRNINKVFRPGTSNYIRAAVVQEVVQRR